MPGTFSCPGCGAPLQYSGEGDTVPCPYCNNSVIVPEVLRRRAPDPPAAPGFQPVQRLNSTQLAVIKDFLRAGKKIEAIKVYRQATLVDLKDAKELVEAIQAGDPELNDGSQGPRPAGAAIRGKITSLLIGLFFLGIAAIFPLAFFPIGIDAWQLRQYAGAFFAFLGAIVWAVVWGGIGVVIMRSRV